MHDDPRVYRRALEELQRAGRLTGDDTVLVVCGGYTDRDVLLTVGLQRCVISNLDERHHAPSFEPYEWTHQDAEKLTLPDNSFDYCIVHQGLHHCHSPHRALLEMFRVARKGVVLVEPCDSVLTRVGQRSGISQEYEQAAVFDNQMQYGGVGNSATPNFVYRFSPGEIQKVINCVDPTTRSTFTFNYEVQIPWDQLNRQRQKSKRRLVSSARSGVGLLHRLFPRSFSNTIVAVIQKPRPDQLQPWLRHEEGEVRPRPEWFDAQFRGESS